MNKVNRQEFKYYIKKSDVAHIKNFLSANLFEDSNSINGSYKISSLYFDTFNDDDLNQKLDGIKYREKYRLRTYNGDLKTAKFEIKRKLNNCIEKISVSLNEEDAKNIQKGDFTPLDKYAVLDYVPHRMNYLGYLPIGIVSYERYAYYLPINNIRITIDCNLATNGFSSHLSEIKSIPLHGVQNKNLEILEIKYEDFIPDSILVFLSRFKSVRSSVSKYSLCRVHNNTEINGDDPLIPF